MSYAAVAAANAPPPAEQPRPDPALLNTEPPTAPTIIDENSKVNVVAQPPTSLHAHGMQHDNEENDSCSRSPDRRDKNSCMLQAEAEGRYLRQVTKNVILRPGVAGGLIGIVNVAALAGLGCALYLKPQYRRDKGALCATTVAALVVLSVEEISAQRYLRTARGQREADRAKREGSLIYQHARDWFVRPEILGGAMGVVNMVILGGLGCYYYRNPERPDRRMLSAIAAALFTIIGGEACIARHF